MRLPARSATIPALSASHPVTPTFTACSAIPSPSHISTSLARAATTHSTPCASLAAAYAALAPARAAD